MYYQAWLGAWSSDSTLTLSLTTDSPHVHRILFCHFLLAASFSSFLFTSLPLSLSSFFCLFSFIASLIFDPFSSLGHWSLSLWPSSFVAFLHHASPCLTFLIHFVPQPWVCPNLSESYYLCHFSFVSAFGLCVVPFSLCLWVVLLYRSLSWAVCQVTYLPGRWISWRKNKNFCEYVGELGCICTHRSTQLWWCVCLFVHSLFFLHLHLGMCVRQRRRKHWEMELWFHCISLLQVFATVFQSLCLSS